MACIRTKTKQPHRSGIVVHQKAVLVKDSAGHYTSIDGKWHAQFGRYDYGNQWTLYGSAIPGGAECDTLREAQEYVADDRIYENGKG